MIGGCGIDMVCVSELERAMRMGADRFSEQVFTDHELAECGQDMHRLAGRFAVKEAVLKCLGTGIRGIQLVDVRVTNDDNGKPLVDLAPSVLELAGEGAEFEVSMSHEGDFAIGMAVQRRKGSGQ